MERYRITKEEIYKGSLILVNQVYPIQSKAHFPKKLYPADDRYPNIQMEARAAEILRHIFREIQADDRIVPVSGYRTLEEQTDIYESSMKENGKAFTEQYVALPNHSEHQTGLAMDLALFQEEIDFIRPYFAYDGICGAFRKKAAECGFIERYPKEKEAVTGISWEPWHFRYVGSPHAVCMQERGLCLEEYIELLRNYPYGEDFLSVRANGRSVKISFVKMRGNEMEISLPESNICQLSGNNVDGMILTVWGQAYA